jgi:hypothetical protein
VKKPFGFFVSTLELPAMGPGSLKPNMGRGGVFTPSEEEENNIPIVRKVEIRREIKGDRGEIWSDVI